MFSDCYLHEQHWLHNEVICGINVYGWGRVKEEAPLESLDKKMEQVLNEVMADKYWQNHQYWLSPMNVYDYRNKTVQELIEECLIKGDNIYESTIK